MNDATSAEAIVQVRGVDKIYRSGHEKVYALSGIDLDIMRGEYLAIMGPSGSGKSTLFNMIGALDKPSNGEITVGGVSLPGLTSRQLSYFRGRHIGYVFQSYNLNSTMTALENVTLPMTFAGVHSDEARVRGMELLTLVGLGERWQHRPKQMSGGQQQRTAIARALANRPSLLLCDEPTANLDFASGKDVHRILRELNREKGVTVICATHDHQMLEVSSRMVWIAGGLIDRVEVTRDVEIKKASLGGEEE